MDEQILRSCVLELLSGGQAHLEFEPAIADLPERLRGARGPGSSHTPWRLLEHMRIAQRDILRFCIDPDHVSPDFPAGYWPLEDAPPTPDDWDRTVHAFRTDLKGMMGLVSDANIDLLEPISHGNGQTILREALLVADHNSYHLGQLVAIRKALGAWPQD